MCSPVRDAVRPTDCLVAMGLPLELDASAYLERAELPGIIRSQQVPAGQYLREIVYPWRCFETRAKECGVHVLGPVDQAGLARHLSSRRFRILVLVSHFEAGRVELADGLHSICEVVEAIPIDFAMFIDLCVCHPAGLNEMIRAQRPLCHVRSSRRSATLAFWLPMYSVLFHELRRKPRPYLDAQDEVIRHYTRVSAAER